MQGEDEEEGNGGGGQSAVVKPHRLETARRGQQIQHQAVEMEAELAVDADVNQEQDG